MLAQELDRAPLNHDVLFHLNNPLVIYPVVRVPVRTGRKNILVLHLNDLPQNAQASYLQLFRKHPRVEQSDQRPNHILVGHIAEGIDVSLGHGLLDLGVDISHPRDHIDELNLLHHLALVGIAELHNPLTEPVTVSQLGLNKLFFFLFPKIAVELICLFVLSAFLGRVGYVVQILGVSFAAVDVLQKV